MKLFLSADIEGTAGIADWKETEYGKDGYEYFRRQMTREVAAACEGAIEAADAAIVVKDAHDSARNILPDLLPERVRIHRGWSDHPYCMMYGLDESFDGVFLTGYHSAAGMASNPLSHTMALNNNRVTLNGAICPEAMINSLTAAYLGVPVLLLTGDKGLCDWMHTQNPNIGTVAVSEGTGAGSLSMHPAAAAKEIREAAARAVLKDPDSCLFPMPEHFHMEIDYKDHFDAYGNSFYPGAKQLSEKVISYDSDNWMDVLCFIRFVL